ncbi:virulence RhuM family protein [Helicobacter kayseriensis]|uniref:virulence RhuM family protein n=1 Tax=Helicobacter kayseriensis TaxID=2905877 RepID=UPI001E3712AB|nr:virulence RhuM family protein [Helicobacter kayseriensis]MCE3047151.1 virulence RhuM family protein [Helicobacter kayseriensis]MCE3048522.1 virulence RhuM family protein [Helicobacter kayseriensis]
MDNILIYHTQDGKVKVELYEFGQSVWLTQELIAKLFDTSKQNVSLHIQNIFEDAELREDLVVKENLTTAKDGKQYKVKFYSLEMILAIGFRVRSKRGLQFRKWANENLQTYLQKGFLIDTERLKNPNGRTDYFDELLERIREIRASEMRFYQKVRDLFALSSDYDSNDKATQMFFAQIQNKLLYAITEKTASELICERADHSKPNMGLSAWKGSVVRKGDIIIAKNYLNADELDRLNRLVNVFLESAELRVKEEKDLTLSFWKKNVDRLLEFQGKKVLEGNGNISKEEMEKLVYEEYEIFDALRKEEAKLLAQKKDEKELEDLAKELAKNI